MSSEAEDLYLEKILNEIRQARNLDFTQYRKKLLARRVMVRVRKTRHENFKEYLTYLKAHPREIDFLMDVMTINVTEFFRDENVFGIIEKKVIPDLFSGKEQTNSKRVHIWSCGCASGEEAYSVLMLIAEYVKSGLADYKLKIYGTDIDARALAKAKEGVYEAVQFGKLSEARIETVNKYFYDTGNSRYWVREEWPAYMNFHYHDIVADVPLEPMDIILCRNMLIYFDRELQNQVMSGFYKSLNKGGFLILGNVESLSGDLRDEFIEYDRSARIYLKK